jgi:hypothetical protein
MSVTEMKLKAINHLNNLTTEEAVKGILEQLEKLDKQEKMSLNLAQHYPAIKEQYGTVLEKLAK